jgi:hypothetical protein
LPDIQNIALSGEFAERVLKDRTLKNGDAHICRLFKAVLGIFWHMRDTDPFYPKGMPQELIQKRLHSTRW